MSTSTAENEFGLQKILDFTRLASIITLLLHFYYYCYQAFENWSLTTSISDRLLSNIQQTGLFNSIYYSKLLSLGLLVISLLGAKGKKDEKISRKLVMIYLAGGFLLFLFGHILLKLNMAATVVAVIYGTVTALGFILILTGGTLLLRLIRLNFHADTFNEFNETFPQEERLITNEFSINFPAEYKLRGKTRKSWINIINPFRGILVLGGP